MSSRSTTRLAQVIGGFVLILVAIWVVLGGPGGEGGSSGSGEPSRSVSASPAAGASPSSAAGESPGSAQTPASGLATIPESQLPQEGRETLALIHAGGPFPYDRDGITFHNREGILPPQDRGYYSEYTVPTPGLDHRGAKRIVCGEAMDCYYTQDHYASFAQIEEGQ